MAKGQRRAAAPTAAPTQAPVAPPVDLIEQVEQPAEPPVDATQTEAPAAAPTMAPPPVPTMPLDAFIAHHEKAAQDAGLVVTAISHPDATERHHDGVYSGFPITAGELSATYSDGSKH